MKFIDENVINTILDLYEQDEVYLKDFKTMLSIEHDLTAYLDPNNYDLLSAEELTILEYLTCVIYHSTKMGLGTQVVVLGPTLEKYEEKNWDVFNNAPNKGFSKVLDHFFNGYPQEDLLALVEDAIVADGDTPVTIVGAEIIVVTCKSIIDTLHELN
jgi:hypothetical protein